MLSEPIGALLAGLHSLQAGGEGAVPSASESVININKITERAGTLYEKLRYLVDYKEERHIRRSAIERIIRRLLQFEGARAGVGLSLIQELIAGGYLANNAIPEGSAARVEGIIRRYHLLAERLPLSFRSTTLARRFLTSLAGTEIEAFFFSYREDDLIAETYAARIKDAVQIEIQVPERVLEWQILLACYRGLYNADDDVMRYTLWLKVYPDWQTTPHEQRIAEIAEAAPNVIQSIQAALRHPLSFRLLPRLSNLSIYFSLLREVVRTYGAEAERVLSDHELLSRFAHDFLEKNYRRQHERTRRSAVRAVLYVLLTKILLAAALEIPYALYVLRSLDYVPIAINSAIHPLLLLLATFSVRPLGERNTKVIVAGLEQVVSAAALPRIRVKAKERGALGSLFALLYGTLFVAVFGAVVSVLRAVHFDLANIVLFLAFLALVSFFALRIRHSGSTWRVRHEDHRLSLLLFAVFTLPIIRAGKWLSRTFSSINVFVFVMDFIIETPFKLLLHFSDAFLTFLREKQEEV